MEELEFVIKDHIKVWEYIKNLLHFVHLFIY